MREYETRALDLLRSPRAWLAALAVVAVFGLSIWASPIAAAIVVAPLAVVAALAATPHSPNKAAQATRANLRSGLARHTQSGHRISILDPETALLQRWYFELRVADEVRRCRRYGTQMALLFIQVEGEEAHATDPDWTTEVQMDMVQVLARQMRGVDLASRIGEREFALCLPQTSEEGALSLAWRISQNTDVYSLKIRKALAPEQGYHFDALYQVAEAFTPQKPVDRPGEQTEADAARLVELIKSSPYGEVPITQGQTVGSAKAKLRRASKRAGVGVRIWESDGVLHFEHRQERGVA